MLASRCAADAGIPNQPLQEAMISATRNMQTMAASIWADFKGYGKGVQSDEDWQIDAMRALGEEGEDFPNMDEELLAAWDHEQGAPEEQDQDYDPWGNEGSFHNEDDQGQTSHQPSGPRVLGVGPAGADEGARVARDAGSGGDQNSEVEGDTGDATGSGTGSPQTTEDAGDMIEIKFRREVDFAELQGVTYRVFKDDGTFHKRIFPLECWPALK